MSTDNGDFVIKSCRFEDADRLRAVDAVYLALDQDAGDIVAPHLRTNNGGILVEADGDAWVAMRYVQHDSDFDWRQPSWNLGHTVSAAKGLARFHAGAQPVLARSKRVQETLVSSLTQQVPEMLREMFSKIDFTQHDSEVSTLLLPAKDWLIAETDRSVEAILAEETQSQLTATVLHGDFHPGNCLFRNEQLRAIIDFEYVHCGSPIFDLAYGAAMFGTGWNSAKGSEARVHAANLQAEFIAAYRQEATTFDSMSNQILLRDNDYLDHYLKLSYLLILIWCIEQNPSGNAIVANENEIVMALQCVKQRISCQW